MNCALSLTPSLQLRHIFLQPNLSPHLLQSPALPSAGPRFSSDTRRSPPRDWPASGWTPPSPEARPPSPRCCCSPAWPGRSCLSLPGGLGDNSKKKGFTDVCFVNQRHDIAFKVMISCQLHPYLCLWPALGWSRHRVLGCPASGSAPRLAEFSQARCSLGHNV